MHSEIKQEMTGDTSTPLLPGVEYLNKAQLAERLKIGMRTVELWMQKKIIPFIKIRRRVMFNWTHVQWYLTAHFGIPATEVAMLRYRRKPSFQAGKPDEMEPINKAAA